MNDESCLQCRGDYRVCWRSRLVVDGVRVDAIWDHKLRVVYIDNRQKKRLLERMATNNTPCQSDNP